MGSWDKLKLIKRKTIKNEINFLNPHLEKYKQSLNFSNKSMDKQKILKNLFKKIRKGDNSSKNKSPKHNISWLRIVSWDKIKNKKLSGNKFKI